MTNMVVVDPKTGIQLKDKVVQADLDRSAILCYVMKTVTDEDETEHEVIVKERDSRGEWVPKTYTRVCEFDVVNGETGEVIAEARYLNVTSRL